MGTGSRGARGRGPVGKRCRRASPASGHGRRIETDAGPSARTDRRRRLSFSQRKMPAVRSGESRFRYSRTGSSGGAAEKGTYGSGNGASASEASAGKVVREKTGRV